MLHSFSEGGLEVRRQSDGSTRLSGRFPYGVPATLSDGGRNGAPRKEVMAPRAFEYRINTPSDHGGPKEIHLLSGHDYGKPLASVRSGTLSLKDSAEALTFNAIITREIAETSHGRDALALLNAGLSVGVSPGFRLAPARAVSKAEEITQEPDDGTLDEQGQPRRGAIIRTVLAALLYELSIVTRPSYPQAEVEARCWMPTQQLPVGGRFQHLRRWRP